MRADGLDTGFGSVSEQNWLAGVRRVADELHLARGNSVYEVGCGAGAPPPDDIKVAFLKGLTPSGDVLTWTNSD